MARKNLIEVSGTHATPSGQSQPQVPQSPLREGRPIAGFVPPVRGASPVGGITRTLGNITEKMERAKDLERQLAEGQAVVEIDPALVDGSFINDRLELDASELAQLVEQIREHGQQVPILVRPHPDNTGRYQVAYGHRRLAAVRELGLKVRAVVRSLSDDQLVVSQGQENNARTNLSYIERALFGSRLEARGFTRDIIMSALGVDKAALSKMLIVIRQVPYELISAIGAAPEIGRRRWMELGEKLEKSVPGRVLAALSADNIRMLTSNERFHHALALAGSETPVAKKSVPAEQADGIPVKIKRTGSGSTFVFDAKAAPGFDDFVRQRLQGLFAEFQQQTGD